MHFQEARSYISECCAQPVLKVNLQATDKLPPLHHPHTLHVYICLSSAVALAHGALAAPTKPTDSKAASQPPQKPNEKLKPEAAPQQLGLLLPTGGQPGLPMIGLPAAAATDPMSVKPVAGLPVGLPALAAPQPAALPGAFPGALPGMAAPMPMPGAFPAAAGGYPAAANPAGYPPLAPGFPAAATTGPLMPMQAMPAPMLPTTMPGDGVMGRGE
jgi:hypothetical protein